MTHCTLIVKWRIAGAASSAGQRTAMRENRALKGPFLLAETVK
jgi:hypothetical protein